MKDAGVLTRQEGPEIQEGVDTDQADAAEVDEEDQRHQRRYHAGVRAWAWRELLALRVGRCWNGVTSSEHAHDGRSRRRR
jgi:hypothetical protein